MGLLIVLGLLIVYALGLIIFFGIKIVIFHIKLTIKTNKEIKEIKEREKEYGDTFYIDSK